MRAQVISATLLAAAALVAWEATRAWSARKCLDGKQTCKSPEVCEFKAQIMAKSAMQAVFASPAARKRAQADAQSAEPRGRYESEAAYEQRMRPFACDKLEKLAKEAMKEVASKLPACPGSGLGTAPGYTTDETCKTTAHSGNDDISDEQAQKMNTCEEFIDASRVHEMHHQWSCNETHRKGGAVSLQTVDQCADEEVKGYHIEMAYLFDELSYRKLKCTPSKAHVRELREAARRAAQTLVARSEGAR